MRALALAFLFAGGAALAFSGDVRIDQLPPEARQTLGLIEAGGPFPYARDGVVFNNREAQLPKQARGYYREYTVKTPGARDRGARRIIVGRGGERYYTQDHYRTFRRIIERASHDE
ncbi:MAG TPA: ribonuclease domain-containing protein [Burkholderiales bacterium]|nr:ribonuclease domain-containing protein [Burkholderiales bacterium]